MSVATIKSPDKFRNTQEAKKWLKEQGYKLVREVWINEKQSNRCAELTMLPASGKAKVNVFLQGYGIYECISKF